MTRRVRTLLWLTPVVLVLAGIALVGLVGGLGGQVAAILLIGVGCVGIISLCFLEVGLTEDRERDGEADGERRSGHDGERRSEQHRGHDPSPPALSGTGSRGGHPSSPHAARPAHPTRISRRPLGRMRGERRRLH